MRTKHLLYFAVLLLTTVGIASMVSVAAEPTSDPNSQSSKLVVVWTSGDPEVAHRVCLMYSHAAKTNQWFDEVRLIVWGPSARLLAGDKDLQAKIKTMMQDGVNVQACVVCADSYGVSEILRSLDIEVKAMGRPLTDFLQSDYQVLTF